MYGLTEQQRTDAIKACDGIEAANDKIQKALRNIIRIFDNAAKGRPADEGLFQPVLDLKHRPYCGPAAIAILTGVPLSKIERMLKRCRKGWGNKPIKGVYAYEAVKVLRRLGCKIEQAEVYESTVTKFADDVRHAGAYLVNVTGHFMVACAGVLADNSFPQGVPAESYGRGARRVLRAWKVIAPALPKFTVDDVLVTSRPAKPKMPVQLQRVNKVVAGIKRWERKEKLAKTKLKKLRHQLAYYKNKGVAL